jgi:HlyD family secretion protein
VRRIADYVLDVEKQARTVDVEVAFTNPEDFSVLLAGYSADIEIILDARSDVARIPTEAVMTDENVYVYLADQAKIARRHIRGGLANWDFTEVLEGVRAGEQVVVNIDIQGLKDGASAVLLEEAP